MALRRMYAKYVLQICIIGKNGNRNYFNALYHCNYLRCFLLELRPLYYLPANCQGQ